MRSSFPLTTTTAATAALIKTISTTRTIMIAFCHPGIRRFFLPRPPLGGRLHRLRLHRKRGGEPLYSNWTTVCVRCTHHHNKSAGRANASSRCADVPEEGLRVFALEAGCRGASLFLPWVTSFPFDSVQLPGCKAQRGSDHLIHIVVFILTQTAAKQHIRLPPASAA